MAKKKGPPYDDDPGCKYIVIQDPWPGDRIGKDRNAVFWNKLGAWVYYMLDKKHEPEAIFSMNTRAEVIVQLPERADITPILGAHVWRRVLMSGKNADRDRVSFVFEYNYRIKGEPGNHNWVENFPAGGEPPESAKFPVKFPYPRPNWAAPRGKASADLALPLPPSRQRTPSPDTSLYRPYEGPSHYAGVTENPLLEPETAKVEVNNDVKAKVEASPLYVGKMDPYEEAEAAAQLLKQEPTDDTLSSSIVKQEYPLVKTEPASPPSASPQFIAAFNARERNKGVASLAHGDAQGPFRPTISQVSPTQDPRRKPKIEGDGECSARLNLLRPAEEPQASPEFAAAVHAFDARQRARRAALAAEQQQENTHGPPPPNEVPVPSTTNPQPRQQTNNAQDIIRVKPEPEEPGLPPAWPSNSNEHRSHNGAIRENGSGNHRVKPEPREFNLSQGNSPHEIASRKRVKQEDTASFKKIKREPNY